MRYHLDDGNVLDLIDGGALSLILFQLYFSGIHRIGIDFLEVIFARFLDCIHEFKLSGGPISVQFQHQIAMIPHIGKLEVWVDP